MPKRYEVTEAGIARKRKEGRGVGRGADYVPWLTVREVPSMGESNRLVDMLHRRVMHLLSRLEMAVALDLLWHPCTTEVREQFPLDRDTTRAVAAGMGVRHPAQGSVDVVMTTDFLVDYCRPGEAARQVAISVKPAAKLEHSRTMEKLEIERRYWARQDVLFRIATEHEVNERRRDNLLWLLEWRWLDAVAAPREGYWEERCAGLLGEFLAPGAPPGDRLVRFLGEVEARRGWPAGEALSAFRHLGATRRILFDLNSFDPAGSLGQVRASDADRLAWEELRVRAA